MGGQYENDLRENNVNVRNWMDSAQDKDFGEFHHGVRAIFVFL